MNVEVRLLEAAKWEFLGLDFAVKHRIRRRVRRLVKNPEAPDVHRILGTDNLYRVRVAGLRLLFHRLDRTITVIAISRSRTESEIEGLLERRRAGLNSVRAARGGGPTVVAREA